MSPRGAANNPRLKSERKHERKMALWEFYGIIKLNSEVMSILSSAESLISLRVTQLDFYQTVKVILFSTQFFTRRDLLHVRSFPAVVNVLNPCPLLCGWNSQPRPESVQFKGLNFLQQTSFTNRSQLPGQPGAVTSHTPPVPNHLNLFSSECYLTIHDIKVDNMVSAEIFKYN